MNRKISIPVLVVTALVMAGIGFGVSLVPTAIAAAWNQPTSSALASGLGLPKGNALTDFETSLENVYAQVNPSVVAIDVLEKPQTQAPNLPGSRGFGFGQQQAPTQQAQALGSGFVWDSQGHIITNNHVIDGAESIKVTFSDGTIVPAKVVGADPDSDLAVLQVSVAASELHPVQVADSTKIKVGQFSIAIGNPFGEQNTMTTGIISALGRSLPVNEAAAQGPSYTIPDVIQTDTPINPGNSGGVLLNSSGQVLGVTSAIESPAGTSAGIGFAIPSAIVEKVVPALIKSGHYEHPYIGISGASLNPDLNQANGLKAGQRGAMVIDVAPGGPAAKAGLRGSSLQGNVRAAQAPTGGDVIIAIDGQAINSFDDVVAYLARATQINQTVNLTVMRDGKEQNVKLTLTARPAPTGMLDTIIPQA